LGKCIIELFEESVEVLEEIRKQAGEAEIRADFLCEGLFKDYGLGLKLVNLSEFTVTEDVLKNPKEHLEKLIQDHYKNQQ